MTSRRRPKLEAAPLTAAMWPDLVTLFGERGACGGCWCMAWRRGARQWQEGRGASDRRAMRRLAGGRREPGVLGYVDSEAVAWLAIAPRAEYRRLGRSRVLKPVDDHPVWSVTCFVIRRDHRRRGLSVALLRAGCAFAAERRAREVEGYPQEPTVAKTPDPFVWTGLPSVLLAAGFREVARRSAHRPIMRRWVRSRRR